MERALLPYKSSASKKWLIFFSGMLWFFACSIFLRQGIVYMLDYSHHIFFNIILGTGVGIFCFFLIFLGMVRKHIHKIVKYDAEKFKIFSFTDIRIYVIVALLVASAVLLSRFHYADMMSVHVFYISMGIIFFLISLQFFFSLLFYKKMNITKTPAVN